VFEPAGLVTVVELETVTLPFEVVVVLVVDVVLPEFVFEAIVAAGDGDAIFVFVRFVAVLVFVPASPQAIPKAPNANTDDSAITFFITNSSLLSSSKCITNLFFTLCCATRSLPQTQSFLKQTSI
jgi:hypothetical protein